MCAAWTVARSAAREAMAAIQVHKAELKRSCARGVLRLGAEGAGRSYPPARGWHSHSWRALAARLWQAGTLPTPSKAGTAHTLGVLSSWCCSRRGPWEDEYGRGDDYCGYDYSGSDSDEGAYW